MAQRGGAVRGGQDGDWLQSAQLMRREQLELYLRVMQMTMEHERLRHERYLVPVVFMVVGNAQHQQRVDER